MQQSKSRLSVAVGVIIAVIAIVVVVSVVPLVVPSWETSIRGDGEGGDSWGRPGAFGDMFGVANALFSGLAFGGVIFAIVLQTKELGQQRTELTQTRFDNTFFHMLRLHHDIVAAVQMRDTSNQANSTHGRECFQEFLQQLLRGFDADTVYPAKDLGARLEVIEGTYQKFYSVYQADLGHYFRNLYRIVRYVDENAPGDVPLYLGLLRAQLSSAELGLLFYNALSSYGREKFKPLIERHALLENMPRTSFAGVAHAELYAASAFGRNPPSWFAQITPALAGR